MIDKPEFAYVKDYLPGTAGYRRFADENAQLQRVHERAFLVKAPERNGIPAHLEVWTILGEGPLREGQPMVGSRRHMLIDRKTCEPRPFDRRVLEELWRDDFRNVSGVERVREVEAWFASERREIARREEEIKTAAADQIIKIMEAPVQGAKVSVPDQILRPGEDREKLEERLAKKLDEAKKRKAQQAQ